MPWGIKANKIDQNLHNTKSCELSGPAKRAIKICQKLKSVIQGNNKHTGQKNLYWQQRNTSADTLITGLPDDEFCK